MTSATWWDPIGQPHRGWMIDWTSQVFPGVGCESQRHHIGNAWSQFSSVIYLLFSLLTPCLKVKPRKTITGLWGVSNCVFHPPDFTEKGNGIKGEQRRYPTSHNWRADGLVSRILNEEVGLDDLRALPHLTFYSFYQLVWHAGRLTVMPNTISAQDSKLAWERGTHIARNDIRWLCRLIAEPF